MANSQEKTKTLTVYFTPDDIKQIENYQNSLGHLHAEFSTYELVKLGLKSLESPWVKFSEQLPPADTKILVYAKSSASTQLQVVDSDLYAGGVLRIAIENNHHWCIPTLPEVNGGDN